MKVDDEAASFPEQVIRDTAKRLRAALRKALGLPFKGKASQKAVDPLPSKGKGEYLTYSLILG
jgi:hypothetical protein